MPFHSRPLCAALFCTSILGLPLQAWAQQPPPDDEGTVDELVIESTRSGRRVQDEPIRVEVIGREEIEEKITMRPGNIATLLSETGGLRVQVTSPALGASNIRVQGMRGRYTQFLSDGLPLQGGQAASIGLLQIPPTDLRQVEVIKGAASALYGPSALGGVINLISRRPRETAQTEVLLNATSRDGQDATLYAATPLSEAWGASLTAGLHRQTVQDLDGDGWIDMPGYERWTVRPRLFWASSGGADAYLTLGATGEQRTGGTLAGRTAPDGLPFAQDQDTRRYDAGLVVTAPVPIGTLHLRASGVTQKHDHVFGALVEEDRHDTGFGEVSLSGKTGSTNWLAGLAVQRDAYRSAAFPTFDFTYTSPAAFAQAEYDLREDLTLAASARLDDHSRYGSKVSPRFSVLYKPGPWTLRASIGRGFFAPTPFVEEIEAAGLSRLDPLTGLKAETAESASIDAGWRQGAVEANLTVFGSNIHDAVQLLPAGPGRVRLANVPGDTRTRGAEALLRYRWKEITVTGSYVFVDAREPDPAGPGRRAVPLTPRHAASLVAVWERHDWGRIGLEAYYTGDQILEDDPYRATAPGYFELGAMVERRFGRTSVFLNLENLLDVRQTRYEPLVRPGRARDGRWTVDAWAPTEGFVANVGVRMRWGGD